MAKIQVGDRAPEFTASTQDGRTIRLADYREKQAVVLFFYPKDNTAICTREACSFRDAREEIVGLYGAEVVGVSRDTPDSHARFIAKHRLPFPLVSDPDGSITKAFDAQMLGGIIPVSRRVTYVVDGEGVVRGVFTHTFAAEQHVDDVRACLASLAKAATS